MLLCIFLDILLIRKESGQNFLTLYYDDDDEHSKYILLYGVVVVVIIFQNF